LPGERGCRIDVEAATNRNERALIEVQLSKDSRMTERNLLSISRIHASSSDIGDTVQEMARKMPQVICINFLDYVSRKDNPAFHQPIYLMYELEPQSMATYKLEIHDISLEQFRKIEPDFTKPLHHWLYTWDKIHTAKKTIEEVLQMQPALQEYANQDGGFQQFCRRYQLVSSDPKTRDEYIRWISDLMRLDGIREGGIEDGIEIGMAKGMEKGMEKAVFNALKMNMKIDDIAELTELPRARIEEIARTLM
jgi:predicted transposase/invertase (TIGR01784 family)